MISENPDSDLFIQRFKEYGTLSESAESDMASKVQCISKKKGSYIIKEGQIVPSFFFTVKGLTRSFYKREGQEITAWLGYEGQNFAAITSFFENRPSHETIECLEDCDFLFISGKDMNDLYKKHNEINSIGRKIVEEYCILLDKRIFALQTMSATERYNDLVKNDPEVIKRVPLIYIASFLGISPETLSRVRKK